jgi:hypothetical protein
MGRDRWRLRMSRSEVHQSFAEKIAIGSYGSRALVSDHGKRTFG